MRTFATLRWFGPVLSAQRMLKALADGETNPAALAALADRKLRATPEQLCDALGACTDLKPVHRRLLKMALEQLQFLEQQVGQLDQEMANLLSQHQDAVKRLAEVPSLGVNYSHRSPKGNRHMRRVLNPTANAAARTKGSIFEIVSPLGPAPGT